MTAMTEIIEINLTAIRVEMIEISPAVDMIEMRAEVIEINLTGMRAEMIDPLQVDHPQSHVGRLTPDHVVGPVVVAVSHIVVMIEGHVIDISIGGQTTDHRRPEREQLITPNRIWGNTWSAERACLTGGLLFRSSSKRQN